MASFRRLENGKWKATVTLPDGRQRSKTDPLKKVVQRWAGDLESSTRTGDYHDDRPAKSTTLSSWWEQWSSARVVSANTKAKNATHWRVHVEPRWGRVRLADVSRVDVKLWVASMQRAEVGVPTIEAVTTLLGKLLSDAVDVGLLKANPASRIATPANEVKVPFFWTHAEAAAIIAELERPWSTFVAVAFWTGLRTGEIRGMRVGQVDLERRLIHVTWVETRQGPKQLPKGRDRRTVPLPAHLVDEVRDLVAGRPADSYVFLGAGGGPVNDRNFAQRVFEPARAAAGVRRGTPHAMRHTAASWLVEAGVDLYRVQALLGHQDAKTTQRYAHLAPDAFERVTAAWESFADVGERRLRVVRGSQNGPPGAAETVHDEEAEAG